MKILVTGRHGQIVRCLEETAAQRPDIALIAMGRPEMDLAAPETVYRAISLIRPDLVISAAAYTAVDQAEDEPDAAFAVNMTGAGAVAKAASSCGAPIIHLSTDYVFSGDARIPYIESDPVAPRNIYGRSKLAGELAVAEKNPRHIILRTAWVYSAFGKNFVKTMLRLAKTRANLSVVSDQWGDPTSAHDLARAIFHVTDRLAEDGDSSSYGIYHLAGEGATNWSNFARAIFSESRKYGGPVADVTDIAASDYPVKATRPANSCLSTEKFRDIFQFEMPEWKTSLGSVVKRIISENPEDFHQKLSD